MRFPVYHFISLIVFTSTMFAVTSDSTITVHPELRSQCKDKWIAWDKFHHFTTSALLVCAGSAGAHSVDQPRSESMIWGVGFSFSMGLSKEIYDMGQPDNHFCWKDIMADLLGILFGIWIMGHW